MLPEVPTLCAVRLKTIAKVPPKAISISDAIFGGKLNSEIPYVAENRKGDIESEFINQVRLEFLLTIG